MAVLDLNNTFLHALIHQTQVSSIPMQNTFVWTVSFTPSLRQSLKPILRWARRNGIVNSAYIDDILIIARSREQAIKNTQRVLDKLAALGILQQNK